MYPLPALPAVIGSEGAGRVEAVGPGVRDVAVGDRVAYAGGPTGAYSETRVLPADRLVRLPDGIEDRHAAAMMLKGMTAEYLLRRTFRVEAGQTILVHAAAGGVGLIACQWASALGATVIGTVGTREKAALAASHGCAHPIVAADEDFVARVRSITHGRGVPVVYDSVGRDTFLRSLDCLSPRGLMVSFGQSSGMVPPLDITALSAKGSLYLTRPTLFAYTATREDLLASAAALFDVVLKGAVRVEVGQTYPLREVARAHADLEARRTVGSTVLIP
jgi:NADPH2:quinone reductase